MGEKRTQSVQDTFLNKARTEKAEVTVFLISGVKLMGIITWYDPFCLLLKRGPTSQLVYKHAISTIMPTEPLNLNDEKGD